MMRTTYVNARIVAVDDDAKNTCHVELVKVELHLVKTLQHKRSGMRACKFVCVASIFRRDHVDVGSLIRESAITVLRS